MHDPLALAIAIDPTFVELATTRVEVECDGRWTRGMSVTDLAGVRHTPWALGLGSAGERSRGARGGRGSVHGLVRRPAPRPRGGARVNDAAPTLAVIGAINVDLVVAGARCRARARRWWAARSPSTMGGRAAIRRWRRRAGRAGRVAMIGAVGDDRFGVAAREALASEGIDVRPGHDRAAHGDRRRADRGDPAGENQILGGARRERGRGRRGWSRRRSTAWLPTVVFASLEVPHDAMHAAAVWSAPAPDSC